MANPRLASSLLISLAALFSYTVSPPYSLHLLQPLRRCGFFEQYARLSDQALLEQLARDLRSRERWNPVTSQEPDPADWLYERPTHLSGAWLEKRQESEDAEILYSLAALDTTRVWATDDLEYGVSATNRCYQHIAAQFIRLTRGCFQPTTIEESWLSPEGPITLKITVGDSVHIYHPEYADDWLDGGVFNFLQQVFARHGCPIETLTELSAHNRDGLYIVRATATERRQMEQVLGWQFELPKEWGVPAKP